MALANGIWLCRVCAKSIDDDPDIFTRGLLEFWRHDAEDLARREKGRPTSQTGLLRLRFALIRLDPYCAWVPARRFTRGFQPNGGEPDIGFHEASWQQYEELGIKQRTHTTDPVFDVSVSNDGLANAFVSGLGIEPVEMWTVLKGYPTAYRLRVIGKYVVHLDRFVRNRKQMTQLADPIVIEAGGAARMLVQMKGFHAALSGNESLVRLCLATDSGLVRSRMIYMGMY